jgi:CDP-diacylglycerol--serine O-phosphatidyltransferase
VLNNLPLRRRREDRPGRFRRGVFLLPSMFTVANLFCGYACVVYSTQGDFDTAALFIGIAMVLDTLDGFVARLTKSSTAFGVQLDSLADVVSFGLAPALLAFMWGLWPLKRLGWAAGFIYVTAAAMRLARFNIQTAAATDKRYFVGMPSPAAASVIASTVYLYPYGLQEREAAFPALAMVLVPDGQHDPLPQHQGDRRRLAALLRRALHRRRRVRAHRRAPARVARRAVLFLCRCRIRRLGADALA